MAQAVDDVREGGVLLGKSADQGALAHAKFLRNDLDSRFTIGKEFGQSPFDLVSEIGPWLWPAPENLVSIVAKYREQPVIGRCNGGCERLPAEGYLLKFLTELHRTSEELGEFFEASVTLVNEMDGIRQDALAREMPAGHCDQTEPEFSPGTQYCERWLLRSELEHA